MADPFIKCHAMLHEFRHTLTVQVEDEYKRPRPLGGRYGSVGFVSFCAVCGCERVRWMTRHGGVINRYYYPRGYTWNKKDHGGEPAPKPAHWRTSFVEHLFEGVEDG